jgi:hypothetical protein
MIHKIRKYHQKLMKHVQWMPVYHLQRTKRLKEAGEVEQSIAYLEA